ncbi:WXG100 family type VII secretion target [Actinophytocola glycyrrhizae]|uniref:ESAT-6-like protein n=1 Tax=Actinophytocola glycyrrhizae TaxID=2044873 RepID=A0ABV9RVC6_9PSEU
MGDIKVTFGSLEQLAGDIRTQVGAIEGNLNDLQSQISSLEQLWEGGASAGFQATKQQWFTSADHLRQVLAKIEMAVVQSTDGYRDAEDRNTKRWDA